MTVLTKIDSEIFNFIPTSFNKFFQTENFKRNLTFCVLLYCTNLIFLFFILRPDSLPILPKQESLPMTCSKMDLLVHNREESTQESPQMTYSKMDLIVLNQKESTQQSPTMTFSNMDLLVHNQEDSTQESPQMTYSKMDLLVLNQKESTKLLLPLRWSRSKVPIKEDLLALLQEVSTQISN